VAVRRLDRTLRRLPPPLIAALRPIRNRLLTKEHAELEYWHHEHDLSGGRFPTEDSDHYERILLAIAGEADAAFLAGKVVADFGCGPRGSLAWAKPAAVRIGIDVLADRYCDDFTADVLSHGMVYLKSTEHVIPLPDAFVDVMFTLNAMDHVADFPAMCSELLRVLKPGGMFAGSFNLGEPPTQTEPQQLDEARINRYLLDHLDVQTYRLTAKRAAGSYEPFFDGLLPYTPGEEGHLWVRAVVPRRT
jgi:SAM-dependent methyltransferase